MLTDIRYGLRQLLKHPAFTVIAIVTLALGIGANTAIFSVVNAVLLKPLPFPHAEQLVALGSDQTKRRSSEGKLMSMSYPDFFDFREQNRTFAYVACYTDRTASLKSAAGATSVFGIKASADLMNVLGIQPARGHGFAREDEKAGGGPGGFKVILSDDFWRKNFAANPDIIGQTVELDRRVFTIIGVMPPGFQFPIQNEPVSFYVTHAEDAANPDGSKPNTEQRGSHFMRGIGRLKSGVSLAQAQADLSGIAAQLEQKYPDTNTNFGVALQSLREEMVGDVRTALYILFGAVVCVLLIANANVANLLLARASVRGKEIALRAALGASRRRIIRQLLTESILLSTVGGALGLLLAIWGTDFLVKAVPDNIPRIATIKLDGVVLAFTLLVSLATGVIFGLVPAWQASHVDLNSSLKPGSRTGSGGESKGRLRNGLIVAEVALALVLLICAGLLLQSFARLGHVSTGMRTDHLLTARISLPETAYPQNENITHFFDQLLPRLSAIPGVDAASVIVPLPMSGNNMSTTFDNPQQPLPEGQRPAAPVRIIGSDYFKAAGIPVRSGRVFDDRDQFNSPPVVIVNERFAQKFFPGQNAVGKQIKPGFAADDSGEKMREIIGVVGNVKHQNLKLEDSPEMYLPRTQIPFNVMSLVVRTAVANPGAITSSVRRELTALDPNIPLTSVRVFDEYISRSLARPRFNALLLSIFAGTALVLTAIGIYGVLAYSVAQRTNEIGIRIALGAEKSNIFRLVVGQAMLLVGISLAIGLAGAFATTRLLSSMLFGVSAWDPFTFFAIVLLMSVVAFFAAWIPARRASAVDPIVALRTE